MERSEPTLVPEWLKNAGSLNGGSSISHSDDHAAGKFVRNKSFVNSNGSDVGRSFRSDRATSSYFRRSSSSNGSSNLNPYSNFGRNRHDRDWEKDTYDSRDRNKVVFGDRRQRNTSDPLDDTFSNKFDRDGLRRSQSMISGKRGDTWPKKVLTDSSSGGRNTTNKLLTKGGPVGGVNKTSFERDFPSLGIEERAVTPEVRRVPSLGFSSAIQSLRIGTSGTIGGEKWTSALAEVPVLVGNNGSGISSSQHASPLSPSLALGTNTSLNMAEAVLQGPSRAQTTTQISVGTQKLEELAIKQSRQLIPLTPSMPKTLVLSSSDKQKPKAGPQQHPLSSSLAVNHSARGGSVKGEVSKTSSNVGKLQVLKPVREQNAVTPLVKDNSSSTLATTPSVSATRGLPNNPVPDRKPVLTVLEKRPTSQARSRNEFFNSVRKKSVPNFASVSDSASSSDKFAEIDDVPAANTSQADEASLRVSPSGAFLPEVRGDFTCKGDASQEYVSNGKKHPSSDPIVPDEEEAAFLRSLGWEEDSDEGELTEEEISAFLRDVTKYIKSKPSLKLLQGVKPKFLAPFDSQIGGISCGLSSSNAKLES
ncbi:hypothetical protein BUALT_Bualt19G0091900 [Buddleja alternifolia]|uniref:Uncharacterized protein n=1 Tax=Buddleja alternifolia TaxID=168488 RepID=A0AAV6WAN1_9LAMI|nr:hypothetical protein BUALT_Bualt19G0091900 [Buddleja alternifolia]